MAKKLKGKNIITLILVVIFALTWVYNNLSLRDEPSTSAYSSTLDNTVSENTETQTIDTKTSQSKTDDKLEASSKKLSIDQLTAEIHVIQYLKQNNKLPDYYITKNEARKLGWQTKHKNLCDAAPGKAIGGDHFGNFEKKLPIKKGRKYTEADINYNCGSRGQHRIVFSNDGLIFVTKNHYKSFEEK